MSNQTERDGTSPEAVDGDSIYSSDERIEAIFQAAIDYSFAKGGLGEMQLVDRKLSDAIDAAMSHAYAEGRADERREWLDKEMREATERAFIGGTVEAIERIWGLPPKKVA